MHVKNFSMLWENLRERHKKYLPLYFIVVWWQNVYVTKAKKGRKSERRWEMRISNEFPEFLVDFNVKMFEFCSVNLEK